MLCPLAGDRAFSASWWGLHSSGAQELQDAAGSSLPDSLLSSLFCPPHGTLHVQMGPGVERPVPAMKQRSLPIMPSAPAQ